MLRAMALPPRCPLKSYLRGMGVVGQHAFFDCPFKIYAISVKIHSGFNGKQQKHAAVPNPLTAIPVCFHGIFAPG